MKILILSGFLGSGKTTVLLHLAHYLVDNSESHNQNKVVILENEVGEVGVDDSFIKGDGFVVEGLFSGCACCKAAGNLLSLAWRINAEVSPEWLLIETTGIAYPHQIQASLEASLGEHSLIFIVVDVSRWQRLRKPLEPLLKGQVEGSDLILLNKIDLADSNTLQEVKQDIQALEPAAAIVETEALTGIPDEIWQEALSDSV